MGSNKRPDIRVIIVRKGEKKENRAEDVLGEMMAEKSPHLAGDINL